MQPSTDDLNDLHLFSSLTQFPIRSRSYQLTWLFTKELIALDVSKNGGQGMKHSSYFNLQLLCFFNHRLLLLLSVIENSFPRPSPFLASLMFIK